MKNKLIFLVVLIILAVILVTKIFLNQQEQPVKPASSQLPMSIETTPKEQISDCSANGTTCTSNQGIIFVHIKDTTTQHGDLVVTPNPTIQISKAPDYNKAIAAIHAAAHDNSIHLVPYLVNLKMTWYCDDIENCVAVDNQTYTILRKNK